MATTNKDRPRGFWPAYTLHGGPPHIGRYRKGSGNIFRGDLVKSAGAKPWLAAVADDVSNTIIGVAADMTTATGTSASLEYVYIYDDLVNTVFIAQADTSQIDGTSTVPAPYQVTFGTGSTVTTLSAHEIDASVQSTLGLTYVIDKVDRVDNAWGKWVDVYCTIAPEKTRGYAITAAATSS